MQSGLKVNTLTPSQTLMLDHILRQELSNNIGQLSKIQLKKRGGGTKIPPPIFRKRKFKIRKTYQQEGNYNAGYYETTLF